MKLSVLLPVYNESKTLLDLLDRVGEVDLDKEIVLVDDYSTDGTRELLKEKVENVREGVRVFYHPRNMGKGSAVRTALENAMGDYCIIQDADLEYDPFDYKPLFEYVRENGCEVIYGSRFLKTWRSTSPWHFAVNKFLTVLTNILFGGTLTDMETCYKMVRTDLMRSLDLKAERFELEPEITAKILKKGYRIPEIPISYRGRGYDEGKKITWKDGVEAVLILFRMRFLR